MEELQSRRGPGRPPKQETVGGEPVKLNRPNRKPFGGLDQKLAYEQRSGYHRHWFNDVGGRIMRAQEAGYEHVLDKEGHQVKKVVGVAEGGGPQWGFLMEIPEEWYQEDMKAQQDEVNAKEEAMRRGKLTAKEGDGSYVPSQGISIVHGSKS